MQLAIVFAGKRKSGKDYCSDRLLALIGDEVAEIGRLSGPLKKAYAEEHDLDYAELLTDSPYKEQHRARMITWGEERRNADAGFFARKVLAASSKPILIISDARRPGDIAFFLGECASRNHGARRGFTRYEESAGLGLRERRRRRRIRVRAACSRHGRGRYFEE